MWTYGRVWSLVCPMIHLLLSSALTTAWRPFCCNHMMDWRHMLNLPSFLSREQRSLVSWSSVAAECVQQDGFKTSRLLNLERRASRRARFAFVSQCDLPLTFWLDEGFSRDDPFIETIGWGLPMESNDWWVLHSITWSSEGSGMQSMKSPWRWCLKSLFM